MVWSTSQRVRHQNPVNILSADTQPKAASSLGRMHEILTVINRQMQILIALTLDLRSTTEPENHCQ